MLLALIIPLVIAVSAVMSLGSAFIPMLLAWGFAGRALTRQQAARTQPSPVDALT